ncbi:adenine nucleotide transporter BT1, chloroplastic/mitochondrial-like [Curcuma longa]|uniref:adenine nucleotide transporter BT1, chloroplastic/mitochondrial-like n=1 Tax=Curcuma longa TaxID=136217 RepID=UPI003D9DDA97
MADKRLQAVEKNSGGFLQPFPELGFFWNIQPDLSFSCNIHDRPYPSGGLFASVSQMGVELGVSSKSPNVTPEAGFQVFGTPAEATEDVTDYVEEVLAKKKKSILKVRIKVRNPHLRRLLSGGIAGAVSRTCVAPMETIRTHLMVGSNGNSTTEVFQNIMKTEGWKGLFRGNFVNVIRVAPSKAIELFAFDTAKKVLAPKEGEQPKLPIPPSLVAGAFAGVSSTLCTYPLELLKTRLTIQRGVYDNLLHAFVKIIREEGPAELFRGLTPSLIGVVPYAATNYYAYDSLKKLYRKAFKKDEIGNVATLLIGSAAGALSSSATFPLEVARKHMQVGAVGGRQVYKNMLHALLSILEQEGIGGLYRGLGPSCTKLVPAAGISFMCYEACKKILIDQEDA